MWHNQRLKKYLHIGASPLFLCFWDPGHLVKKYSPERWKHKTQMTASTNCLPRMWKMLKEKLPASWSRENMIGKHEKNRARLTLFQLSSSLKVSLTQEGQTPLCFFRICLYPTWPACYSHCQFPKENLK